MTIELTLDIETIPDQTPGALEQFIEEAKANFKAPSGMTKGEAVAALGLSEEDAKAHTKESAVQLWVDTFSQIEAAKIGEENWRKTSFDGARGQVAIIGWQINDGEPQAIYRNSPDPADEILLLQTFNTLLSEQLKPASGKKLQPVKFIGHYIKGFDLLFLFRRSVICKVKPCVSLNVSKYSENLYDTCAQWTDFNGHVKLDALCKILGIESPKQGIDGSKVWDYILEGRIAEVAEYCKGDVRATYRCYKRMTFADCK